MAKEKKKGFVLRALDTVEHVGNALPNPATIFLILTGVVIVLSAICAACGVSVTYDFLDNSKGEITQKTVAAVSLLAPDSIRHMVTTVVGNFTGFFALGTVFTIMIGVGVADGTGFMSALLRKVAASTPKAFVTAVVVFLGIMSNIASSTGYVVLVPLGAVLFMAFGRHPIAGLAAAFAGVSGGWSANLLIGTNDPMFAGMSTQAAQMIDPSYNVLPVCNWYFMIASTFLITIIGTFVTDKIVEPRLAPYVPDASEQVQDIGENEKRGMRWAGITALVYIAIMAMLVAPQNGLLRNPETHAFLSSPFMSGIIFFMMLLFLLSEGKLLSGAGGKKALRSTYVFGLPAAVLWMTYVISNTVLIIAGRGYATEMPYVIQLTMLCLSVHSLCLLFTVSGQRASAKAESNLEENALKDTGNV